jgi:hypothetical protein
MAQRPNLQQASMLAQLQQHMLLNMALQQQQQQQQQQQGMRPGMPHVGPPGNLAMQHQQHLMAVLAQQNAQRGGGAVPGMVNGGLRAGPAGLPGAGPQRLPGQAGSGSAAPAATPAQLAVAQSIAALRPGQPPPQEPPDGYEWVQCAGKLGPEWFAVPRARAQALRAASQQQQQQQQGLTGSKRRAEGPPAGAPPAKAAATGAGKRRDEGGGATAAEYLDVMEGLGEVERDAAEAARAIVAQAGHVQEEYLLSPGPTMTLVARAAQEGGVRAVGDSVYPFLSLAAEAFVTQLLHSLVKMRLQREDMGK